MKERFQKRVFKVRSPFVYGRLEQGTKAYEHVELHLLKHQELLQFYANTFFFHREQTADGPKWKKEKFIVHWVQDPDIREVSTIAIDPSGTRQDIFNLWSGYLVENKSPQLTYAGQVFQDEDAAKDFAVRPIFKHVRDVIANGNLSHTEWLFDWLANIAQRPAQRTEVAISIYGEQGTGKGIIFDWLRNYVFGTKHTFQTANPENDLFGRFSVGLVNKTLVQVDEVKHIHEHADKLKDAITNRSLNFEKKGKDIITVDAFANLVFTSNNENALRIPSDDRRFVLFRYFAAASVVHTNTDKNLSFPRCCSVYRGNTEYFSSLASHLHTPGVNVWFFKFLQDRDLSRYPTANHFQSSRPITEYYCECQRSSIPLHRLYLSAFINGDGITQPTPAEAFFQSFSEWTKNQNFTHSLNSIVLGREMRRIEREDGGVVVKRTNRGSAYVIDKVKLKQFLISKRHYDEHVCT